MSGFNMKLYFGRATLEDNVNDLFVDENGAYYYYMLELRDDDFVLRDTCGRNIPFEYEFIKDLANVSAFVLDRERVKREADDWLVSNLRAITKLYGIKLKNDPY